LRTPGHRWQIQADVGAIEQDVRATRGIVDLHANLPAHADDQLVTKAMGMAAAGHARRNIIDHEKALAFKRDEPGELAESQGATRIATARKWDEPHAGRKGRFVGSHHAWRSTRDIR